VDVFPAGAKTGSLDKTTSPSAFLYITNG
jgi:hypothetical protein